ncbi:FG-GAP repeat protein [bacterium BMS3Abin05]|nr:FG-GAP repeat protein [bacterium BMS3Abin05]GBE27386.1 FG-GAP repeat protein [bacterium BMS3Bbin03]HDZ12790.1 T9SS type A sorting domain-containing protein [Bacteroidota bacterium]
MKKVITVLFASAFVLFAASFSYSQVYIGNGFSQIMQVLYQPKTQTAVDSIILPKRIADLDEVHSAYDFDKDGNLEFFYITDETGPNSGRDFGTSFAAYLYEYNPSTGDFDLTWKYSLGEFSWASFPTATVSDLDGDGNKELVIGVPFSSNQPTPDANPDRLLVFEGEPGTGLPDKPTATWNFDVPPATNTRPSVMSSADIDGDGKGELAIGFRKWPSAAGSALMICSLDGDFAGIFTQWKIEALDSTSGYGSDYSSAITDADNDGHLEALFSLYSGDGPQVFYEATGPDTYQKYVLSSGYTYKTIQAASHFDINNDGKEEVILGRTNGSVVIDQGITDLATADSTNTPIVAEVEPSGIRGMAAGDFNGNGYGDIFVGGNYGGTVWWMKYSGTGSIADSASYTYTKVFQTDTARGARIYDISFPGDAENIEQGFTAKDMTGDGNPELLIAIEDGDSLQPRFVMLEAGKGSAVREIPVNLVQNYALYQNYPNPFNPTTEISYSLKKMGAVTIVIYNSLGEKVRTLVNAENKAPGTYHVTWNATNDAGVRVTSGVYYYAMKINNFKTTRHMVLMK